MAEEAENGQEKTERPTEKRLREAREKGQVARSRELATAAVFVSAVVATLAAGGWMAAAAARWMRAGLALDPGRLGDTSTLAGRFADSLLDLLWTVSPVLLAALLGALLAPLAMGGIRFSGKAIVPKPDKLDPIKGLKRIYGRDGLAELVKSLLRVLLIAALSGAAIVSIAPEFVRLMHQPLGPAAGHGFAMAIRVTLAMSAGLLLLAALDVPYQLWSHRRKLMMTRQELRDELKETEGRPEVKAKIRRQQQAMAQRRMMEAIPGADVVLVNPTHYAVALAYDGQRMRAPRVVAKGAGPIAQAIRDRAEQHRVPIVSAPPLARVLYRHVEIGQEIPVTLYSAVAQILGYVHQLRAWRRYGGRMPDPPALDAIDEGR